MRTRQGVGGREPRRVVEGRDIGTVVFPDAVLVVYLTADPAARRPPGQGDDRPRVRHRRRRHRPTRRCGPGPPDSPLVEADGAVTVDTTGLGIDEVVEQIASMVEERLAERDANG